MGLNKTIGRLLLGWCWDNLGVIVNEILADCCAKKLHILIGVKTLSQWTSSPSKEAKGQEDVVGRQIFQAKCPIIAGRTFHQNKSIAEATNWKTVLKRNVHVDSIEVFIFCFIQSAAMLGFGDSCIRVDGRQKFAAINPLPITAVLKQIFIIAKLAATHNSMELLCCSMRSHSQTDGNAEPGWWRSSAILFQDIAKKSRGIGVGGSVSTSLSRKEAGKGEARELTLRESTALTKNLKVGVISARSNGGCAAGTAGTRCEDEDSANKTALLSSMTAGIGMALEDEVVNSNG
jgi:hypothetical protein